MQEEGSRVPQGPFAGVPEARSKVGPRLRVQVRLVDFLKGVEERQATDDQRFGVFEHFPTLRYRHLDEPDARRPSVCENLGRAEEVRHLDDVQSQESRFNKMNIERLNMTRITDVMIIINELGCL